MTNIPDVNSVKQFSNTPLSSPHEDAQLCGPCESKFAAIMNKEINNNETNSVSDKSEAVSVSNVQDVNRLDNGSAKPAEVSASNVQDADGHKIESVKSEKKSDDKVQVEIGLNIDDIILNIPVNLVSASANSTQVTPVNECSNPEVAEEALKGSEGLSASITPVKNGLKMGALLYAVVNNASGATDDFNPELINQFQGEETTKVEACNGETKGCDENVLKTGALLSAFNNEIKQVKNNKGDKENISDALAQNARNAIALDNDKAPVVEELFESFDENSGSEHNHLKPATVQKGSTGTNITENNNSNDMQRKVVLEVAKGTTKPDGFKLNTDNSAKAVKIEATPDNTNMLNHAGIKLENSKMAEAATSGSAPKPAAFNQVLDNIVYVIKGNNKLGVTVEHESLGKLNINLNVEKGVLNVHINASEKITREFIENNIQYIVDSLAKDGVSVGGFSVSLKEHKDQEGSNFVMNNNQEKQIVQEEPKISAITGLVSVFA